MRAGHHVILILIATLLAAAGVNAQSRRTVTPVSPVTSRPVPPVKEKKPESQKTPKTSERPGSVVEQTDDTGRTFLLDTLSGNEWVDSVALAQPKAVGNIFPLLDAVHVSVDLWPALMRAFNSGYGIGGVQLQLALHNRYFPTVEVGISSASVSPEARNFTFKSPLTPYFKVGMDYNFMYNSNPGYRIYVMARYGITRFAYDYTDVTVTNSYWQESAPVPFPRQHSTTGFVEVGAGLSVKLVGPLSAGWNIKYHRIIHHTPEPYGQPMIIPGFGKRTDGVGVSLSLIYTLPLHAPVELNKDEK